MKIKSCPFCNKEPMIEQSIDKNPAYRIYHACKEYSVPAKITIKTQWCRTREEAVNIWDDRRGV